MDKRFLTLLDIIMLLALSTFVIFAQGGGEYEGPDDPAGDPSALKMGLMDGNEMLTRFRNNTQIGYKFMTYGSKWPKSSAEGLQIFDFLAILIGSKVYLDENNNPVTTRDGIINGGASDSLYYVETIWNYHGMHDMNEAGDVVWGLHPVPGYFNEASESPAVSTKPETWPPNGWPSGGDTTKWEGEWNGRFGRGVHRAQKSCYFVANDAQDQEYTDLYKPRPGHKIGDKGHHLVSHQIGKPWGGLGLRVAVRGFQWENPQCRDVIFWEYNISNISDYDLPVTTFGFWVDMGVGNMYQNPDDQDDVGDFEESVDMAYVWDYNHKGAGGYRPGTFGLAFLESAGIPDDGIDNDDDGLIDEKRNNIAKKKIGPTEGIADINKFMESYGYENVDQLSEHWDADEDQDWKDGVDANGNGTYAKKVNGEWVLEPGESAGNDVGLDGVGPADLNYTGPDEGECNHKPDLSEELENAEPNFGLTDISESDMLGLTHFHFIPWPGDNPPSPKYDKECWKLIGGPEGAVIGGTPKPRLEPTGQYKPGDYAPIFGSGNFNLNKGETQRISCALMGAYEEVPSLNSGGDPYKLIEKKKTVQLIYESDYQFAMPPIMPTLQATAEDGKVILTWNNAAEKNTREPMLGGKNDFEGYKLYKSTDREFSDARRVYNAFGDPAGKVPIFQCDLNNDVYGHTDYALVQGESYFLGRNTGIRHSYIDEDVENGRRYYYALVAYDRGIDKPGAQVAPAENTSSIKVNEQEEIISHSKNVAIVTPHQYSAGFVSPELEIETPDNIVGTGKVSFNVVSKMGLKSGNIYSLEFIVDTIRTYPGFPDMGYKYRNIGYIIKDSTNNNILIHETPEHYTADHIKRDVNNDFYYLKSEEPLVSDIFDGISLTLNMDSIKTTKKALRESGWISGNSPIDTSYIDQNYQYFKWQTEIEWTENDITITPKASDIDILQTVIMGRTISSFDKSNLLFDQALNMKLKNMQFQDSTGNGPYLLDAVAYDANGNGTFDKIEDDIVIGYNNNGKLTPIFVINFRKADTESEYPDPGDVYRLDTKRPFAASDEFIIKVKEPTEEMKQNAEDLDAIKVVPNPYIVTNKMEPAVANRFINQKRRIMFTHIPAQCKIKIFNTSGYLIKEINVNNSKGNGIYKWNMLTKEGLEIAPGIYFYHLKSKESGKEKMGKFAVIK